MLGFDMVEPTDHLYQEGNVIGKRNRDQKKSPSAKKTVTKHKSPKEKRHRYQSGDLGNLIDLEI